MREFIVLLILVLFLSAFSSSVYGSTPTAEYFYELGLRLYQKGEFSLALEEFQRALAISPGYEPALRYINIIQEQTSAQPPSKPPIPEPRFKKPKEETLPFPKQREIEETTISSLFEIGKVNSHPLKIAEGQIILGRRKVIEALRKLFPNIGVEYTSTEGRTVTDPYRSRSYGLKFEQILYDSKQRSLSLKRERTNVEVAEKNYQKEENELLFEILKAYYQLRGEKKNKEFLEILKDELDRDMELASTLKEADLITQIENLKIGSIYKKAGSELASQLGRYRLAITNLKKALGIEPREELPPLPDIDFKEDIPLEKSSEECRNIGFTQRPEVLLWEKSIEATKVGLRVAKVENRPKLLLESFGGKSGEAYGWQALELGETWNVIAKVVWLFGGSSFETGYAQEKTIPTEIAQVSTKTEADTVSFKTNILDKIEYYSQLQEGKVALKQAEDELVKLKKDIAWEIEEGLSAYIEGKEELKSNQEERTLRNQELELKETLFKAGEIELSELMEAKFRLKEAETSLVKAKLKMYLGIILLDKATGFNLNLIEKL